MSDHKHVKSVSSKEQRMYEHILENAKKSGLYGAQAKEIAARTILKHHREPSHHTGR